MHTNYYFLRLLAPALTEKLAGFRVVSCFSQEKDELVVGLRNGPAEFWLKAQLGAAFPALALPETFQRARTNSVDLLPALLGREVQSVVPWPQDRLLTITFRDQATLTFKLYGPRPNAVFRPAPAAPAELFHQAYIADADLVYRNQPVPFIFNEESGLKLPGALADLPARYLRTQGYDPAPPETKIRLFHQVLAQLEKPAFFYLLRLDGRTRLSLLPLPEILETLPGDDPIGALRRFVPLALSRRALEAERKQLLTVLGRQAEEASRSAELAQKRLYALAHEAGYRHAADLIMANLHQIPAGAASVEVLDFYTNEPRTKTSTAKAKTSSLKSASCKSALPAAKPKPCTPWSASKSSKPSPNCRNCAACAPGASSTASIRPRPPKPQPMSCPSRCLKITASPFWWVATRPTTTCSPRNMPTRKISGCTPRM